MNNDNLKKITLYIAVWGWQIIGMIFLSASFIFFAMPESVAANVFQVSFFLAFVMCLYMTLKRKREFYEEDN